MEKVDREKLMVEIWKQYNATKDVEFLAKACEEAPFFGQKEMAFEIAQNFEIGKQKEKKLEHVVVEQFKGKTKWWMIR